VADEPTPPVAPVPPEVKSPSVTTFEEDRTTAGQRRINLVWEATQAVIAVAVTLTACVIVVIRAINPQLVPSDNGPFMLLASAFSFIVGTYFTRTNHTKTGGVGAKDGKDR
jgi:hypothetical protein